MYTLSMFAPLFQSGSVFENPFWVEETNEKEVRDFFRANLEDIVQIGGNATLGKGLVRFNKYGIDTPITEGGK